MNKKIILPILIVVICIVSFNSSFINTKKVKEKKELSVAQKYFDKKLYYDAANEYRKLYNKYGRYEYLVKVAESNELMPDLKNAIRTYEKIIILYKGKDIYPYEKLLSLYGDDFMSKKKKIKLLNDMKSFFPNYDYTFLYKTKLKYKKSHFSYIGDIYGDVDGYRVFKYHDKYGLMKSNTSKIQNIFQFLYGYSKDTKLCAAKMDDEWFYVDENGFRRAIADEKYDELGYQNNGYGWAKKGNKYVFLDYNLKIASDKTFDEVTSFNDGIAAVKVNGKWGFINKKFKEQTDFIYDDILFDTNKIFNRYHVFFVKKDNQWQLLNNKFEKLNEVEILEPKLFISEQPAAVKLKDGYAFIDVNGKIVSEKRYLNANSYRNDVAMVEIEKEVWAPLDIEGFVGEKLSAISVSDFDYRGIALVVERKQNKNNDNKKDLNENKEKVNESDDSQYNKYYIELGGN